MFLEHRDDADEFRQKLLNACLRVNLAREDGKDVKLPICIVGGGATGVELAAELVSSARSLRAYGLEVFDDSALRITLLEAGPRILPALSEELSQSAAERLRDLGIDLRENAMVTKVEKGRVHTKDGAEIEANMIVWAAGVRGDRAVEKMTDLTLNKMDRIVVRPTLQSVDDDRIFAIGDCAYCELPDMEGPVPPRAQSARQMSDCVFQNLRRAQEGKPLKDFHYEDHGALISLARFTAVGALMGNLVGGRMAVEGRIARWAYMSLYRMHLLAIHGTVRGSGQIVLNSLNKVTKPAVKLH